MPPEFDPRWEYADAFLGEGCAVFDPWSEDAAGRFGVSGYRFGRGRPDGDSARLFRDEPFEPVRERGELTRHARRYRTPYDSDARRCAKCRAGFWPNYRTQVYCSRKCSPRFGGDFSSKYAYRPCRKCGEPFYPRISSGRGDKTLTVYCSRRCYGIGSAKPTEAVRGPAWVGRFLALWAAGATRAAMMKELGIGATTLTKARNRLGLARRPSGRPRKRPPPAPTPTDTSPIFPPGDVT